MYFIFHSFICLTVHDTCTSYSIVLLHPVHDTCIHVITFVFTYCIFLLIWSFRLKHSSEFREQIFFYHLEIILLMHFRNPFTWILQNNICHDFRRTFRITKTNVLNLKNIWNFDKIQPWSYARFYTNIWPFWRFWAPD